ncbi:CvpA family protein [Edaphobacter aggregans]|uniref:CvpA family protein n=1 Tax=Edaphobacter aggregans TaxID=570835 RepID=UPI000558B931|nr:CvpA family protein [Edaphobacter aggregans]
MNLFDGLLVAVLVFSTVQALFRGLLLELFSLAGLAAGVLLAAWNYPLVASPLSRFITNPAVANAVAFLLIAIGVMVLAAILGRMTHSAAHAIGLGFFDRLGGAAFGLARGWLACVVILMAVTAFLPTTDWLKNSRLTPYFLAGAHAVSFVVPHDLEQLILDGATQLKHNAPDWIKPHS